MSIERAHGARRFLPSLNWLSEDWRPSPKRDALSAAIMTIIAVAAAYGEAHPLHPGRYFTVSHPLPHTPNAAFLLVIAAGAVLAWRHRYPRLVLCASTLAVVAFTAPGWVNGVALLLPAVALGTLAAAVPEETALAWAVAVTVVLMAVTAANNPFGTFGGG